jgi:hypothetical protein
MVRVPPSFVRETLMPEFDEVNGALFDHLERITDDIIQHEIYEDASDAREIVSLARDPMRAG